MASTTLTRERWHEHPNYPAQVLLLGSHRSFREVSRTVIERARSAQSVVGARWLYHRWMMAMKGHERYEESKLYPYLRRRFGVVTATLQSGHQRMHVLEGRVRDAFEAEDAHAPDSALHDALAAYDAHLREHLLEEEDLVIPLLLAMSPEEFRRYGSRPIERLLKELGE